MELKIKTARVKEAIAIASKGSGRMSNIRITDAIGIEALDGNVIFTTTDNATNLTVRMLDVIDKEIKFYACTDSDIFSKLVAKTDSEHIKLSLKEGYLQFEGNGVYNLPLIIEPEDGSLCRIPTINVEKINEYTITKKDIDKVLQYNKFSVSKSITVPYLMGYCMKDGKVYTFNSETSTATLSKLNIDKNISVLIPQTIINLLSNVKDEKFKMYVDDNKICFESSTIKIDGTLMEDLERYPSTELDNTINSNDVFINKIKINKTELTSTLDRIAIFVENDDEGFIGLTFTESGMLISSKKSSGVEKIPYIESNLKGSIFKEVDIKDLRGVLNTIVGETAVLSFGELIGLRFEENDVYHIIAQSDSEQEDEVEENSTDLEVIDE